MPKGNHDKPDQRPWEDQRQVNMLKCQVKCFKLNGQRMEEYETFWL